MHYEDRASASRKEVIPRENKHLGEDGPWHRLDRLIPHHCMSISDD